MKSTLLHADVNPGTVMYFLKENVLRVHDWLKIISGTCVHFEKI